jgi:ubiquitin-protein ligase
MIDNHIKEDLSKMISWDSLRKDRTFQTLSSTSLVRIQNERKRIIKEKNELNKNGIYLYWKDNDNIDRTYYQMLIGPEDTPYAGGFFIFEGRYPDEYPYKSMCMMALTQGGGLRSHPNFYVNGYVCLSLFGTWAGEPWSSTQNTVSVAYTVQSMFMNNPIQCEPGYTHLTLKDPRAQNYHNGIIWWTLRYAVIEMLMNTPEQFTFLKNDMEENFIKNMPVYMKSLEKLNHYKNNTIYQMDFYNGSFRFSYNEIYNKLHDIYGNIMKNKASIITVNNLNNLTDDNLSETKSLSVNNDDTNAHKNDNNNDETNVHKNDDKIEKKKVNRPTIPPKNKEEGFEIQLEDGSIWIIKKYDSGVKRWIKKN